MTAINSIIKRLERLDQNELIAAAVLKNSEEILDLNRKQLISGVQSTGNIIFNSVTGRHTYANNAHNRKKGRVGQQYILFDTGQWQGSFETKFGTDDFKIVAKDTKDFELVQDYGPNIKGLSEDDIKETRSIILSDLRIGLKKQLRSVV